MHISLVAEFNASKLLRQYTHVWQGKYASQVPACIRALVKTSHGGSNIPWACCLVVRAILQCTLFSRQQPEHISQSVLQKESAN